VEHLATARGEQRIQPRQAFPDRIHNRCCAGLQRDDHGIRLGQSLAGDADGLHHRHPLPHQGAGQVRRAREVVGDATQQGHGPAPA